MKDVRVCRRGWVLAGMFLLIRCRDIIPSPLQRSEKLTNLLVVFFVRAESGSHPRLSGVCLLCVFGNIYERVSSAFKYSSDSLLATLSKSASPLFDCALVELMLSCSQLVYQLT